MIVRQSKTGEFSLLSRLILICSLIVAPTHASLGDRLPEFRNCVSVLLVMMICVGAITDFARHALSEIVAAAMLSFVSAPCSPYFQF